MAITFSCPQCSNEYTVDDGKAGQKMSCPKCQTPVTLAVPPAENTDSPFVQADNPSVIPLPSSGGGFLDIGFTRFITPSWISVIWIICIISNVISFLISLFFINGMANAASQGSRNMWEHISGNNSAAGGVVFVLGIAVSIILHLLCLLFSRVLLEIIIMLFKIEENTRVIRSKRR